MRKEAAYALLSYIYKDTVSGRPEISAKAQASGNLFRLTVRLPVKSSDGSQIIRCSMIESPAADAEGKFRFSMQVPKPDNACGGGEKLVPYKELEAMLSRIQTCQNKGESRCLVSDPGSSNRQILVIR